ncbi:PTS system, mannitol-specific IIB component [Enterococcus sp. DIV1094]|uniref:PTS system mannitol-specific EIICB component n=2 Tax=Candidatus Enterococcus mangumiae TaxID=2230878 RepID=A0ABZ2STM1_9ENTE
MGENLNALPAHYGSKLKGFRQLLHYFKQMIMPNLSIFIAWGLLSILTTITSGDLKQTLVHVTDWLIYLLLPILISYSGAKIFDQKAAVAGGVAVIGMVVVSDLPQIFGAMIIGLITGGIFYRVDRWLVPKVKPGYEMLVNNLMIGLIGGVVCLLGILVIQPLVEGSLSYVGRFVHWLIAQHLLPVVSLVLEPLKIFFLNNVINHGILTPLGMEMAQQEGHSILFLMEANPGPGIGILSAFLFAADREKSLKAGGALMIQAIGGIHEIYFPFVLMQPALFFAVMVGGATGTFVFQLFDSGLNAPVSPGSLVIILANTSPSQFAGVILGIVLSAFATFICALLFMEKRKPGESVIPERSQPMNQEPINQIIFACDAGMGSSAMGAAILKKKLMAQGINMPIDYRSIYDLRNHEKQLVIVQKALLPTAKEKAKESQLIAVEHFLEVESYLPLIKQQLHQTIAEEQIKEKREIKKQEGITVVFLYQEKRRGSQTMGMTILMDLAKEYQIDLTVKKTAVEDLVPEEEAIYLASESLAKAYQLEQFVDHLLIIDHFVSTKSYLSLVKEVDKDVFVTKRKTTIDRTHQ